MTKKRQHLFSITAKDCRFDYFKGSGKGGQKRNKTESGVRCTHINSGATGQSDDTRSQHKNKIMAFRRMHETDIFKQWMKIEISKSTGALTELNRKIDRSMSLSNLQIETRKNGKWKQE